MKVIRPQVLSAAQLAASFILMESISGSALAAAPSPGDAAQPSDPVWCQIKQAQPGQVVEIPPGTYTFLKLDGMKFPRGITVTSADKAHPAVFKGLNITSSQGLTFKAIEVSVNPATGFAVMLGGDQDIHFDHVNLHGAAVSDGNAIMIRNSSDVSVTGSEVHHLGTGINHLDSDHLTFADNFVHHIQSDGIRGGGSSYVSVVGNRLTDFYPKPEDHPDAIQFWTTNTKQPTHDLIITDNVYVRGTGDHVQGIFVGNENQVPPLENVTIERNTIIGGMYHGISIGYSNHVSVSNNIVRSYDDMDSWIMLNHITNSSITDNQATTYKLDLNNEKLIEKRNKVVRKARPSEFPVLKRKDSDD